MLDAGSGAETGRPHPCSIGFGISVQTGLLPLTKTPPKIPTHKTSKILKNCGHEINFLCSYKTCSCKTSYLSTSEISADAVIVCAPAANGHLEDKKIQRNRVCSRLQRTPGGQKNST